MNVSTPALALAALIALPVHAQTVTELMRNGPNAEKHTIVIIGDGFAAGADQTTYRNFVRDTVVRDLFDENRDGAFREIMGALNLFRVDTTSAASGITTISHTGDTTNADGSINHSADVVTTVNTFLGYRFSGSWANCWMEPGANSDATLQSTLDRLVPGWDYAVIVLNTTAFGGCRRGDTLAITRGAGWDVAAHEFGHMLGDLGDEYTGVNATYTGGEPGKVNLSIEGDRTKVKWRDFVNPDAAAAGTDPVEDAGTFAGGTFAQNGVTTRFSAGIFRPSANSRMDSNMPEFNSVGYDRMRSVAAERQDIRYRDVHAGRFTGRNGDDVVLHQENSLFLYTGTADSLIPRWVRTMPDPVWDAYRPGDRFLVGDFDGDGRSDLFVYNFSDWNQPYFAMLRSTGSGFEGVRRFDRDLPGWGEMRANDRFLVGDFNGDGKDDIAVFNGEDFNIGYLLLLRSTGSDLAYVTRYDDILPGWDSMRRNDRFLVGDFSGDGKDDLVVDNQRDWSVGYLGVLRSSGGGFSMLARYDEELPGWDDMKAGDQFHVANFDGDRRDDLVVFNGSDWSQPYLQMLRSTGRGLASTRRFDGDVPGWGEMRRNDRWYPADIDGDGRTDLYAYNANDWSEEYLGTLLSSGRSLDGGFQADWIGSWNLGNGDRFVVANFNGGSGWDDLLVHNDDWFGLLRSRSRSVSLSAIHPRWIHDHRFHSAGWW
jgi:hypothetical protein